MLVWASGCPFVRARHVLDWLFLRCIASCPSNSPFPCPKCTFFRSQNPSSEPSLRRTKEWCQNLRQQSCSYAWAATLSVHENESAWIHRKSISKTKSDKASHSTENAAISNLSLANWNLTIVSAVCHDFNHWNLLIPTESLCKTQPIRLSTKVGNKRSPIWLVSVQHYLALISFYGNNIPKRIACKCPSRQFLFTCPVVTHMLARSPHTLATVCLGLDPGMKQRRKTWSFGERLVEAWNKVEDKARL